MKNVEYFGDLTPRMEKFREDVLNKKPYICAERAMLITETYQKHKNQPSVMKRALSLIYPEITQQVHRKCLHLNRLLGNKKN